MNEQLNPNIVMNNFDIAESGYAPEDLRAALVNSNEINYINFKLEDLQKMYLVQYFVHIIVDTEGFLSDSTYKYCFEYCGEYYSNYNYPTYNRALYEAIKHVNKLINEKN